jgi:predicted dehydrogenase
MAAKLTVGIVGCGNIAPRYATWCPRYDTIDLTACADLDPARAEALAAEFGLRAMSVDALLSDPAIDIIVNLTPPAAHAAVSLAIIGAGKHVYSEKPLALTVSDGERILAAAEQAGVRVGCAPDTFLGGGLQTCRSLIDAGAIGRPVAAAAFLAGHGPESWHPNPHFFYRRGAGPLYDVGPYYLTALVNLLGPIERVSGLARISFAERVANSAYWQDERLPVEVPTHVSATLDFASRVVGTAVFSFDIWAHHLPRIEVYGSEGTLNAPDPNFFSGPVELYRADEGSWREVPLTHSEDVERGLGVADMAGAIMAGEPHRASGRLALHILEVMEAIGAASSRSQMVGITHAVERPAPLPLP